MLSEVWRSTLWVFLAVSPVALSLPLVAEAQGVAKIYRIGHVSLMTPEGMAPYVQEFEKGLRDLGYVKGQNYVIEDRSAHEKQDLVVPGLHDLRDGDQRGRSPARCEISVGRGSGTR